MEADGKGPTLPVAFSSVVIRSRDRVAWKTLAPLTTAVHSLAPSPEHLVNYQQRLDALRGALHSVLGARRYITLEIGSGHGHFLTAYAAAHPERFCVGIDIMLDRLNRSERKRARAKLPNLAFVRASAEDFLAVLPSEVQLDDVLILFPDPWPKRRHHKNRLIQPSFLTTLAARALPAARLCFRTDHEDYFSSARETISRHADWEIDLQAPWPFELATVFQTRASTYQSLIAIRRPGQTPC